MTLRRKMGHCLAVGVVFSAILFPFVHGWIAWLFLAVWVSLLVVANELMAP
jgi:hypothetical protein